MTGAYSFLYCSLSAFTASVPDCLPSCNVVEKIDCLIHGTKFVDQVTGGIYMYDYDNNSSCHWKTEV